jgi:hypothetical protein
MMRAEVLRRARARELQLVRRQRLVEALRRLGPRATYELINELERRYDLVELDGQLERVVNKAAP